MEKSFYIDTIGILETTFNQVDGRLIDHGKRVAYLVYKVLEKHGDLTPEQIRDMCLLATIHDIGAYKTEEIDRMLQFETQEAWLHSIYGYLFVKYLSPLAHLAPVLLFHHANLKELEHVDPSYRHLAQLIYVADRIDIVRQTAATNKEEIFSQCVCHNDELFDPYMVNLFADIDVDWQASDFGCGQDNAYGVVHDGFNTSYSHEDQIGLLRMVIQAMEFRSPQTVSHTVTSTQVAVRIGELMGLPPKQLEMLRLGSMVHDIGKMGIPQAILESPNRFTEREFKIMKNHVSLSASILEGRVDPEVVLLAMRHHERINGSGYPEGIGAEQLSAKERIVAVADVVSALCGVRTYKDPYPKDKVIHILEDSRDRHHLDAEIIDLCILHLDELLEDMNKAAAPLVETYAKMRKHAAYLEEVYPRLRLENNGLGYIVDERLTGFSF